MKSSLLLLALGLTTIPALAQRAGNDYIVTTAGDTLRGRLQLTGSRLQTLILRRTGQAPTTFSPTAVVSYGDENSLLGQSKLIGPHASTPEFVTPLVQGYTSLYVGQTDNGKQVFYIQPADSTYLVAVPPQSSQLTYLRLLPDCPSLKLEYSETLRRYSYNSGGMSRLIMDYNACRKPQQTSLQLKKSEGSHVSIGVKGGINSSSFRNFPSAYTKSAATGQGYQVGVLLNLSGKTRFSTQLEAVYIHLQGKSSANQVYNGNAYYNTDERLLIDYAQIQVPLLFRYTLGNSTLRPFVNAGPIYGINFSDKSALMYHNYVDGTTTQIPPADEKISLKSQRTNSLGLTGGAGLMLRQPSLPTLMLDLRYDYMIDGNTNNTTPNHQSLRLDLSVLF
ncbi:porin family protein [Hymenobacter wooponensis]|uniref:PorT family protein n=1 Tax=Hymenobacter wooponensis TaxID=1525360 RepID=A0A4Z0MJ05_9BACT|nr:porin family protein [Hymenobacter wooponensis]TGD79733.1 PorT family protein [Hymenobacter wooponensis]